MQKGTLQIVNGAALCRRRAAASESQTLSILSALVRHEHTAMSAGPQPPCIGCADAPRAALHHAAPRCLTSSVPTLQPARHAHLVAR
eukprot:scaffold71785_cov65-Phaeocystis_antarctica.AAC.1